MRRGASHSAAALLAVPAPPQASPAPGTGQHIAVALKRELAQVVRQEEAQRLGRLLRPKADGKTARFYTVVARDTVDADFAQRRQRFLAEQGYAYRIVDAEDLDRAQET